MHFNTCIYGKYTTTKQMRVYFMEDLHPAAGYDMSPGGYR